MNRKLSAACLISLAAFCHRAEAATITVTTTNDSGPGSLRTAITTANLSTNVPDTIVFAIGSGQQTITLATALPMITDTATIDGYTESGSSSNTLTNADNAVINIRIVGSAINFEAPNCALRGIAIGGAGIPIVVGEAAPGCVVEGNFIGFGLDGVTPDSGNAEGIAVNSSNNRIGGTSPGSRNVIGNRAPGIEIVQNPGFFATNNVVQGNFIGVDITGVDPAPNDLSGVQISMAPTNLVGGTVTGAGNIVANSTLHGIALFTGCTALGNSTYNNGSEGIYNPTAVVTPPVLLAATNNATTTTIGVTLANTNTVTYRLEFFSSPVLNPLGDGKTLIGTTNVAGKTAFTIVFPRVESSLFLTATATGPETSQYSDGIPIITPPGGATNSWTNSVSGKWEGDSSWSLNAAPSTNQAATLVTNTVTKTVTIDGTTALDFTGTMTISNLTIGAPGGSTNTLVVANASAFAPLDVMRSLIVSNGGAMVVSNSTLQVDGLSGGLFHVDGPVTITSGGLVATNQQTVIGTTGPGNLVLSNATALFDYPLVGPSDGITATLSMMSATVTVSSAFDLGDDLTATGVVWLTGTTLDSGSTIYIGLFGNGRFTASNSTVVAGSLDVGSQPGASGSYTAINTTNIFSFGIVMGESSGGTGSVYIGGGQLVATNEPIVVGEGGVGSLTLSNTSLLVTSILLGENSGSAGALTLAGGSWNLTNVTIQGTSSGVVDTLWVTGGQVTLTSTPLVIGSTGWSRVTESNGTLVVDDTTITPSASAGTLTVAGGTLNIDGQLSCIGTATAIWVTGGQVNVAGNNVFMGQMAVSNGTFQATDLFLGNTELGTITIAGGTLAITDGGNGLIIGGNGGTGVVWMTSGGITSPNATISVGGLFSPAVGSIIASNGTTQAGTVYLGAQSDGAGTFTIAGGIHSIYSSLVLGGDMCAGGTGVVTVTGGELFVTNATHNAVLDVETGTLTVNGGYVQADIIILSNSCAYYASDGGQVVYGSAVLNPNSSLVGDGIPNSWKQQYGLNAFDPNLANEDTDGDGMTDLNEYLTGTDPTNSASYFHIVSVTCETNNMRVKWTTQGGHTNRVYVSTGVAGGGYTNSFGNLSPFIIIPGTGASTTNYLDVGGATNHPGRYYRIGQIP